jgi:hypothetical protein
MFEPLCVDAAKVLKKKNIEVRNRVHNIHMPNWQLDGR